MAISILKSSISTPILENTILRDSVTELLATAASYAADGHKNGPGMHTHARILLMESGSICFYEKRQPILLSAGDIAFLPMGWAYDSFVHQTPRKERCLRFQGTWAESLSDIPGPQVFRHAEKLLRQEINQVMDAIFDKSPLWDWAFMHTIGTLGRVLKRNMPDTLCQQVEQLLIHDPGHRWTVNDVADALCMSESSLAHRFKDEVGISPAKWIRSYRIGQAKELLLTHRPNDVASLLGFADRFHFSRVFSQEAGVPPSYWRRHSQDLGI